MELSEFWTICSANGVVLTKPQLDNLMRYAGELVLWNKKVNLISRKDEENIIEKHILHSLSILKKVELKHKAVCLDIGTGGGLPGIPIKIAREDISMLLIDSIAKKIKITEMLAKHTGLRKISAKAARAEEMAHDKDYQQRYDCIMARAVSKTASMLAMAKPMLKKTGKLVLLKGGDLSEEIKSAEKLNPEYSITVQDIDFFGVESFKKDETSEKLLKSNFKGIEKTCAVRAQLQRRSYRCASKQQLS